VGFLNVLEGCRSVAVDHLIYASSSSVYGGNEHMPFSEDDPVDHPVSLYAATKRSNELMAHSYSHLYGIPTTGLRFFTVYGPWGRPDMAYYKFSEAILAGRSIPVFNYGNLQRDFTYIDDIVDGIDRLIGLPPRRSAASERVPLSPAESNAPFRVLNIGNETPVPLMSFIRTLEAALGQKAVLDLLPMQAGDVLATHASTQRLADLVADGRPSVQIEQGLTRFASWYLKYRSILSA
jgi:UDP-glucuronate 4-epimerase